jgi:hypothetical protein
MEDIRQWFQSGQPYNEGIQLYIAHGTDAQLKRLFTMEAETAFKREKLHTALKQLLHRPAPIAPPPFPINTAATLYSPKSHAWPPAPIEDTVLKALWEQWRPLYAEFKSLQQRLYHVALGGKTDPNKKLEAGQMAHRILDLVDDIEAIYRQRDYYIDNSALPSNQPPADDIIDPVRWATELKNNERYVRDYKAKLEKQPAHKNVAKWAAKLKEKEALVAKYKKLLKLDE